MQQEKIELSLEKSNFKSGEVAKITYDNDELNNAEYVIGSLYTKEGNFVEKYIKQSLTGEYTIQRILNRPVVNKSNYVLKFDYYNKHDEIIEDSLPYNITLDPSITITKLCASENCNSFSGNAIEGIKYKLEIKSHGFAFDSISYKVINGEDNWYAIPNDDFITQRNTHEVFITFPSVPENIQFYISNISIVTVNEEQIIKTELPIKVTRPIEVINSSKTLEAQVYEPVQVTGCKLGSIGTRTSYQETESETRQKSVSISSGYTYSKGNTIGTTQTVSESLGITQTETDTQTSTTSETTSASESSSNTYSNTENSNFSFSTSDGESWSWSFNNGSSEGTSSTEGSTINTGVNGSITVGTEGSASIPLLGKVSGKFETSAGASVNWINSGSNTSSNTTSEDRGYITSQDTNENTTYGSQSSFSNSSSLSETFLFSAQDSFSLSSSLSNSSQRVWDFSESLQTQTVSSEATSETMQKTEVSSSSLSITQSTTEYIPNGRYGIYFRQTTRIAKTSSILIYNVDGFIIEKINVSFNNWVWAVTLIIGNTCEEIFNTSLVKLRKSECFIQPCLE